MDVLRLEDRLFGVQSLVGTLFGCFLGCRFAVAGLLAQAEYIIHSQTAANFRVVQEIVGLHLFGQVKEYVCLEVTGHSE